MTYKRIITFLTISIFYFSYCQEEKTIAEIENEINQLKKKKEEILNEEVDSINLFFPNSDLRLKLGSKLNSINSISKGYGKSSDLNLSLDEKKELANRIEYIATRFYNDEKYVLFSFSSGYAPPPTITYKEISGKIIQVINIHSGYGSSSIDEDKVLLVIFSTKMKELLSKS